MPGSDDDERTVGPHQGLGIVGRHNVASSFTVTYCLSFPSLNNLRLELKGSAFLGR